MQIVFRNNGNFWQLWQSLFEKDEIQYPLYFSLGIEYQKEYCSESNFTDLSFIIKENDNPILGVIMSLDQKKDGYTELSGFGRPILYLEGNDVSHQLLKGSRKKFKTTFENILKSHKINKVVYQDFLNNNLSFLGNYLMANNGKANSYFTQIIDLSLSELLLHQSVRKSYQSLINWGKKNLEIEILDSENIKNGDVEIFQQLHIDVAGHETRTKRTWEIQYEMVKNGEAFIVTGKYENNLVTDALFLNSQKYCYYGVSASKRELFDKPISHAVIWNAILHAKRIGCHFFEMGEQLFPCQCETLPTKKEFGISTFKKGFGGETKVRLNITLSNIGTNKEGNISSCF